MNKNYKDKPERPKLETLRKVYTLVETSEATAQAVKPIIKHLAMSYLAMDEMEEEKNEEIAFLLGEMFWLEKRLQEELKQNQSPEIVIH